MRSRSEARAGAGEFCDSRAIHHRPRASCSRIRRRRACRSRRAGFSTQHSHVTPDKLKTCRHGRRQVPCRTGLDFVSPRQADACPQPASWPTSVGWFLPGPPGLARAGPRAEKAGGDTFSTVMPWRRVMRRARFKNRRGCLGPGACDPSGISDTRPVSWSGRKPSAVHATGALYRPPTSLVKSSPTWIDASRT